MVIDGNREVPNMPTLWLIAGVLAMPVAAIAWFELVYLYFGLTGEDPPSAVSIIAFVLPFVMATTWSVVGAYRAAAVVRRSCRLGMLLAILLPVVAFAVLFLWENAPGRRDLGMGGLMLYSLPFVALGVSAVLIPIFWIGALFATRCLYSREE